jgi:hypothetical protein
MKQTFAQYLPVIFCRLPPINNKGNFNKKGDRITQSPFLFCENIDCYFPTAASKTGAFTEVTSVCFMLFN